MSAANLPGLVVGVATWGKAPETRAANWSRLAYGVAT